MSSSVSPRISRVVVELTPESLFSPSSVYDGEDSEKGRVVDDEGLAAKGSTGSKTSSTSSILVVLCKEKKLTD